LSNQPLSEQYRLAGRRWADLEAAAKLLEETKAIQLSQWILEEREKDQDLAHNTAEARVKAGAKWQKLIENTIRLKRRANKARVYMKSVEMRFSEQQSFEATMRAEMKL
jgi:hypothetical protein